VRNADLVLFLDKGHIVESGSFNELAAKGGRFASLLRAGGLMAEQAELTDDIEENSNVTRFPSKATA
jgi:ATP-binding cassette subfamily B protein